MRLPWISVLQRVALSCVRCSVIQHNVACCSAVQLAVCRSALQCGAVWRSVLAVCRSLSKCVRRHVSMIET